MLSLWKIGLCLLFRGDRTQRGHILGDPHRRDNPDVLDTKSLSLTPFTLVRMMTHLAMLLGASQQSQVYSLMCCND